ncbi:histidine kinase [Pedococcus ginsenosidimutans]|uniref:histidine kinase n=1 Tax=Pedococcus ginsenosidimutans TaxID=490570 RepID=A0ABP8YNN5_9MICO
MGGLAPSVEALPLPGAAEATTPLGGVQVGRGLVTPATSRGGRATRDAARWRPSLFDILLAGVVAALSLYSFMERASLFFDTPDGPVQATLPDVRGAVQVLAGSVALVWRRSAPGLVLAVTVALAVTRDAEHYPVTPLPYVVLVAMYTVAQRWPLRRSGVAVVVTSLCLGAGAVMLLDPALDDEPFVEVVAVVTAWALGRGVQSRQVRSQLLEERAALLEASALQRSHEQAALSELAVARERASLARELHDVVASNVSVIVAQAAAARLRPGAPVEHSQSMATVESLGRQTLDDLRHLVGVLHTSPEDGMTPRALPRLEELGPLVDRVTSAGSPVTLTVTGVWRELAPAVELNAYRIVQESLTNVLKHAPGVAVRVSLDYGSDLLHIVVTDTGTGSDATSSGGSGLFGMRQRAALVGGFLHAGPGPNGGWVVDARIPIGTQTAPRGDG